MVTKVMAWAMVAILAGAGTLGLIQWGKIKTLESDLSNCRADLGAADISISNLKTAITEQNDKVAEAEKLTADMREQGRKARAKLAETEEAHSQTLARLRREQAATQSCDQVRQKLITEATGHEY